MPAVPWTTEAQRVFAKNSLSVYDNAVKDGKKAIRRFFSTFTGEFFTAFPLKDELVNGGSLGQHVLAEDYDLTKQESEVFQTAMDRRIGQIKTLFRYLHKKELPPAPVKASEDSKSGLTAAAKTFITKQRRCHHRSETYYRLNKDWLDRLIQQEMESMASGGEAAVLKEDEDDEDDEANGEEEHKVALEKANKAEAKSRGWNLKVRNAVIKRHFDLASEDDLRAVAEAIVQEKDAMDRAADLNRSGRDLARDPELRKEALDGMNSFLVENAKMCWNYAAMTTITVGVAPDPEHPDKLRSRIVAYGRDVNGKVITDIDPTLAGKIVKQLRGWSKTNLFSPERFAAAAAEHQENLSKLEESSANGPDGEQTSAQSADIIEYDDDDQKPPAKTGAPPVQSPVLGAQKRFTSPPAPPVVSSGVASPPASPTVTPSGPTSGPARAPTVKTARILIDNHAKEGKKVEERDEDVDSDEDKDSDEDEDSDEDKDKDEDDVPLRSPPTAKTALPSPGKDDRDPQYRDTMQAFGNPTDEAPHNPVEEHDDDADGEFEHDDDADIEEDPFDGAKFWANLDTNIPDDGKGKQKTGEQVSGPFEPSEAEAGDGKPKRGAKSRKNKKAKKAPKTKKPAKTATAPIESVDPIDPSASPVPVPAVTSPASASAGPVHPVEEGKPEAGKKRKLPPVPVPEAAAEGGRPKRTRNEKTLSDGTVYVRPTRGTRAAPSAEKVVKARGGGGAKAVASKSMATTRKSKGK